MTKRRLPKPEKPVKVDPEKLKAEIGVWIHDIDDVLGENEKVIKKGSV